MTKKKQLMTFERPVKLPPKLFDDVIEIMCILLLGLSGKSAVSRETESTYVQDLLGLTHYTSGRKVWETSSKSYMARKERFYST